MNMYNVVDMISLVIFVTYVVFMNDLCLLVLLYVLLGHDSPICLDTGSRNGRPGGQSRKPLLILSSM